MNKMQTYFRALLLECQSNQVSDIYFLPKSNNEYQVLVKTNQQTSAKESIPSSMAQQLITYAKYLANLDITERRRPQTGQFELPELARTFIRIATVGDFRQRETMVCRLIYDTFTNHNNFIFPEQFNRLQKTVLIPGLHILAGPMGSGKTTTAFALADDLAKQNKIVLTIEDPVEIRNAQFIQLQVNQTAGMDYEALIKSGLRQRPDVFLIGEIRDTATARATVKAALTGHIVISTIHARSAEGVVPRLLELGVIEPYLRHSLQSITYQRLLPTADNQLMALQHQLIANEIWQTKGGGWHENLARAYQAKHIDEHSWQAYQ